MPFKDYIEQKVDYRLFWLVKCINNVFQIGTEKETMILLEEQLNKDDGVLRRQFVQYLECPSSVENMCKNTLYVYTSTVKKVIKEEIEVDEELSELEIQSMKEFDEKRGKKKHQDKKKKKKHAQADDTIASVESPATDSDKDSDDGKSRDGYSSPDTAIQMSVGDGMKKNSEKMYKRVKVVQEKSITLPEIHVNFGLIPITTKLDITYLYFIKNTISAIPVYDAPEEADYYMPSKFLVGNKSGSLIRSMTKELETIWIPSIERLLIDPFSHDCWTTRTEQNTVLKLRSNSVPSTFVRITREIKSHHDYEMLVDERPADFEQRSNFVDLDKVITFSELFMLQPLPNHNTDDPRSFEPLKQHFLTELRDLLNKIKWSLSCMLKKQSSSVTEHLAGLSKDNVDDVSVTLEKTPAMILQCVDVMENWNTDMRGLLSNIFEIRERDTIQEEFTFWKESEESVRYILDEIESEDAKLFLEVIEKTSNSVEAIKNTWEAFKIGKLQFTRVCSLAKDNLKYISLIMEHYEEFASADFITIIEIIRIWFDDLRTIWVLSPYFGKDINMLRLLIQIANGLCEVVRQNLGDLKTIFKNKDVKEVSEMSFNATKMIDAWSTGYLESRKSIEVSGFHRWEFDKCKLFNKTNYVKRVANDIHEIVGKISQFLNILGPELRSVIKDMIGLDVMINRVKSLYKVFDSIDFDLFCEDNVENWNLFLKEFNSEVLRVEDECKIFIDWCFNNLRSCKEAYTTLERFQNFSTRPVFKEQLKHKYGAILQQYENELTTIEAWFLTQQQAPRVSRHHPPVSGSIFWVRMLFDKIKEPIKVFQTANEFNSSQKNKVLEMYKNIVEQMKFYEKSKLKTWINEAKYLSTHEINNCILTCSSLPNVENGICKLEDYKNWSSWIKFLGGKNNILLDKQLIFKTNLNEKMYVLIEEAEMMENLGVDLPKDVRLLISHKNNFLEAIKKVNNMVAMYNDLLTSMNSAQRSVLKHKLKGIEDYFYAGLCHYKWFSISIEIFTNDGIILINKVKNQYNRLQIVESYIMKSIISLEDINLFPTNILTENNLQAGKNKTMASIYESFWFQQFRHIQSTHQVISKRLICMEIYLFGTKSGRSEPMYEMYEKYDTMLFDSVLKMCLKNLSTYEATVLTEYSLIILTTILTKKGVTVVPNMYFTYNNIIRNVSECLNWLQILPRWQKRSCLCQSNLEDHWKTEHQEKTFYTDIIRNRNVQMHIEHIKTNAHSLMVKINKYLKRWKKFQFLWNGQFQVNNDLLNEYKNQTIYEYENKFNDFSRLFKYFSNLAPHKQIHCIQLDLAPIINQMQRFTKKALNIYADELLHITRQLMHSQKRKLDTFRILVDDDIKTDEDLQNVLHKIEEIRKEQVNVEHFFQNINHHIYVLNEAEVIMPRENIACISKMQNDWIVLQNNAKEKEMYLEQAKNIWSHITAISIETFLQELNTFLEDYEQRSCQTAKDDLDIELKTMNEFNNSFTLLMNKKQELSKVENIFNLNLLHTEKFDKHYAEFQNMKLVFNLYENQKVDIKKWSEMPWTEINMEFVREAFGALMLQFKRLPFLALKTHSAFIMGNYLTVLRRSIPILMKLKSSALKPRHWNEILDEIGIQFNIYKETLTFGTLLKMRVIKHKHIIDRVLGKAIEENNIEKQLKNIKERWSTMTLEIEKCTNNSLNVEYKLHDVCHVLQTLEDDQITMHKMLSTHAVEPYLPLVENYQKDLSTINEVLDKWWCVQQKWTYLAQIYSSTEILSIFPREAEQFKELNELYKDIMARAYRKSKILNQCLKSDVLNEFLLLEKRLDTSKKILKNFISEKRNAFPRFYFMSDDNLLYIYGHNNPLNIQETIVQVFDNIKTLVFENKEENYVITAMASCDGELLQLNNCIVVQKSVDDWMHKLIEEMQKTHRHLTKKAILDYASATNGSSRFDWLHNFQGSVCLVADDVWWTAEVNNVFKEMHSGGKSSVKEYLNHLKDRLKQIIDKIRGEIRESDRNKLNALLLCDVQHRDIIESFINNNVINANDFEWDSVLKSYWIKNEDDLYLSQCSGLFSYGHEFMGLSKRIIATPLTNRIFLTYTQALMNNLGGASIGSTGTGKTETTLTLSKLLGRFCAVINCSDGFDHQTFEQFLNGICLSGVSGLFTRFNRINKKSLSVISIILSSVKSKLFGNKNESKGYDMMLNSKVGLFVTINVEEMNDKSKEIGEIIKTHFRPVTCLLPDFEQICLTMLYSNGFLEAKSLSKKVTLLYKLCDGLSKPFNSVFNLRSLKSFVFTARKIKDCHRNFEESAIIVKALRDLHLSQLNGKDTLLFLSFLTDLFPNHEYFKTDDKCFNLAVESAIKHGNYMNIDSQVEKVYQTMYTLTHRHSLAIVGSTCGGKSAIIDILCETLNYMKIQTQLTTLNPKAFKKSELYGYLDITTREWNDGLLTHIFRKINQPIIPNKHSNNFILFDGDIDLVWTNDLSSAMDDNKMLTLKNGEQIRLIPQCKLLFEVGDLKYATPSTVSRMGLIFVDSNSLGYMPYWVRWLESRNLMVKTAMDQCFQKYVPKLIDFIFGENTTSRNSKKLNTAVRQTKLNMITQLCFVLDAMLPLISSENHSSKTSFEKKMSSIEDTSSTPLHSMMTFVAGMDVLEAVFIQALYLSLGASLTEITSRHAFDKNVKNISEFPSNHNTDEMSKKSDLKYIPSDEPTWYDYFLDFEKLEWISWNTVVPSYVHDTNAKLYDIFVPTIESTKTIWILQLINEYYFRSAIFKKVKRPTIIVGEMGSGKTSTMQYFMRNIKQNEYIRMTISFSARTSSKDVQNSLETNLEKRSRSVFGPPIGKRLLYFIDDLNLPNVDEYGTQEPIAFLRSTFDKRGMYERDKYFHWKELVDICFYAAMGFTGYGQKELDPRFLSLCSVFFLPLPSEDTVKNIFSTILSKYTERFTDDIQNTVTNIIDMTISLYQIVLEKLHQTPEKYMYVFNMSHITFIIYGMACITPDVFKTVESFVRVWRNEFTRVICDRLITQQDQEIVEYHLKQELKTRFPLQANYVLRDPLIFGDCRNAIGSKNQTRQYEDLIDYDSVFYLFQEILLEYNRTQGLLDMVLFNNALDHLIRIHRMLRMDRGHVLLVGLSGNGKTSLSKLSAFTSGYKMCFNKFQTTCNYKLTEHKLKEDLHNIFFQVGIKNESTVLIIDQAELVEEDILEYINNLLISGFVPSLYCNNEKKSEIIISFKTIHQKYGSTLTADICWSKFLNNCLNNLHVVLLMAPGHNLRKRFRKFPGLINKTYIDWIHDWPVQALKAVAERVLVDENIISDEHLSNITKQCIYMHQSAVNYTKLYYKEAIWKISFSLKHMLECMTVFKDLIKKKNSILGTKVQQLTIGLNKIDDILEELTRLKAVLLQQEADIAKQNSEYSILNEKINKTHTLIEEQTIAVNERTEELKNNNELIKINESQMTDLVDKTKPISITFKHVFSEIDSTELQEIGLMESPPESIVILLECIAIIKGYKDVNAWKTLSDMIGEPNFLDGLMTVDVNKLNHRQESQIQTKLKQFKKTFDIKNISPIENSILRFVESVVACCVLNRDIIPLRSKMEKLEEEFRNKTQNVIDLEATLKNTQNILSNLQISFEKCSNTIICLKKQNDFTKKRFESANLLVQELSDKNKKWREFIEKSKSIKEEMIGNCLLCASFLVYAGPFSLKYRINMILNDWFKNIIRLKIPLDTNLKIENQLSDDIETTKWTIDGLPSDEYHVQNGIIITQSLRYPLCIDPQGHVLKWIVCFEKNNSPSTVSFVEFDCFDSLKKAIRNGSPIILTDFENMSLDLKDLLNKNIRQNISGCAYVEVNDHQVEYNKNFRLYLMTKQTNLNLTSDVYSTTTVVNCSITQKGLEDHLLDEIFKLENVELADKMEKMFIQNYENRCALRLLKNTYLDHIADCESPLIDFLQLANTLKTIKSKINFVASELELTLEMKSENDKFKQVYKTVSVQAALFYKVLYDLRAIDPLYQFSLQSFTQLMINSINSTPQEPILTKRITNINKQLTNDLLEFSSICIFEKHKLLFLFQLVCNMEKNNGKLSDSELIFFVKGSVGMQNISMKNPTQWLPNKCWQNIVKLSFSFSNFSSLVEHFKTNVEEWKQWYYLEYPEVVNTIPIQMVKYFDVLMLLRCFRTDRVQQAVQNYIIEVLKISNHNFVNKGKTSLDFIYEKFSNLSSCILILNYGINSMSDLIELANKSGILGPTFKVLTLGIAQENIIYSSLQSAMDRGNWIILQNCNFSIPLLCKIGYFLEERSQSWHSNFRLWLLINYESSVIGSLSVPLLLRSLKVIMEPSKNMNVCMKNALETVDITNLENRNHHPLFNSLLYTSLFLHGILSERKKYNKLGWSLLYNFDFSDFSMCQRVLNLYLNKSKTDEIPWASFKYLIGEIIYGGKVVNSYDRRILSTYIEEYFGDFIYSTYQPFSFYTSKNTIYLNNYLQMERKLLQGSSEANILLDTVNEIPIVVDPEVCGLHSNAIFIYNNEKITCLWNDMVKLYPSGGTTFNNDYNDWYEVVKYKSEEILNSLPLSFDVEKVQHFYCGKHNNPRIMVLFRELEMFNLLLEMIGSTLKQLLMVFSGKLEINSEMEELYTSLYTDRIPKCWTNLSPQTVKSLARYMEHIQKRHLQYSTWSQIREPLVMWLSGLHSPKSYITSLIQIACRKYDWALEKSTFCTSVTRWVSDSEVQREPDTGCYVMGLYLEAARWDMKNECLAESRPQVMVENLPILAIVPIECRLSKMSKHTISLPVYVTSKRGNAVDDCCVFRANFNTSVHEHFWILRGACVLMNSE